MAAAPEAARGRRAGAVLGFVVSDLMVVMLAALAALGVVTARTELTALGALVLLLALLSRMWARVSLEDVDYECEPSTVRAVEGDELVLTLTLANRKPLPVAWVRVREHLPPGLEPLDAPVAGAAPGTGVLGGALLVTTTALGPRQRVRLRFRVRAHRRGHYVLGPARLAGGDPFGFYESERTVLRTADTLVVVPRIPVVENLSARLARPIGERARRRRGAGDPTLPVTVREYRSGDALRAVDWKVSARRGAPWVRVNDSSVHAALTLLLECDTRGAGGWDHSPEDLEQVVRAAAAIARDRLAAGHAVGLLANGVPPGDRARIALAPGAGPGQLAALLDALARVQPLVVRPLSVLLAEHAARVLPAGTGVVCIAAALQPDTRALLAARVRRGGRALLVQVGARGGDGEAPPGTDCVWLGPVA